MDDSAELLGALPLHDIARELGTDRETARAASYDVATRLGAGQDLGGGDARPDAGAAPSPARRRETLTRLP